VQRACARQPGHVAAMHGDSFLTANVAPASDLALSTVGLSKSFDGRPAVRNLDLRVFRGEFYALLGPNGAGKTTTLRMVVGLQTPDAGSVSVYDVDALANPLGAKAITAWF
jgi:ABC-2 type transport system ATP-binding protein